MERHGKDRKNVMRLHSIWIGISSTTGFFALLAVAGCATPRRLAEPQTRGAHMAYAAAVAPRTLSIPVAYAPPDVELQTSISGRDFLDNPVTLGYFRSGEIAAREFGNVARANFGTPSSEVSPVGKFSVKLDGVAARRTASGGIAVTVEATVAMSNAASSETAYRKHFMAECSAAWEDEAMVPNALYDAFGKIVRDFLEDWSASSAVSVLSEWADKSVPGVTPPELLSLDFSQQGNVYCGSCRVACNGYEGFRAKGWADAQIEQACRRKLGIEPERVRIVYDEEKFDPIGKTWRFEFRTFARTKMVLTFNKVTRHGFATGDIELMGMPVDKAAEALRRFVHSEMDARAGMVTTEVQKGEARVRFDDIDPDRMYDLITIGFRLVQ